MLGDVAQRIAALAEPRELDVHAAHESVKVQAQLVLEWQRLEQQVDQEGLAAPDRSPQVQAAHRLGLRAAQVPPARRARAALGVHQFGMDAVQFHQRGALRRVVLPLRLAHAERVARARQ